MKNKTYYFIVPITFSESDGTPFVDVSVVESMAPYVSDDETAAKNIAKTYEKQFNQPFGIVELKSIVGEEMPNELKPCPFCGSNHIYYQKPCCFGNYYGSSVTCLDCGANIDKQDDLAIEAWNRRAEEE